MPEITFHGLRPQLIAAGIDIVTIAQRLGHAKPTVTLAVYSHMYNTDDSKAAAAINAALRVSLKRWVGIGRENSLLFSHAAH
jgi:integrase